MEIRDRYDYADPGPQVVRRGRLHRLEIECYVSSEASPDQIAEFVSTGLGFGGIGPDNPLYDGSGFEVRDVVHVKDLGVDGYTLWDAKGEGCAPNSRKGRTVHRRPGEPLGFDYTPPLREEPA